MPCYSAYMTCFFDSLNFEFTPLIDIYYLVYSLYLCSSFYHTNYLASSIMILFHSTSHFVGNHFLSFHSRKILSLMHYFTTTIQRKCFWYFGFISRSNILCLLCLYYSLHLKLQQAIFMENCSEILDSRSLSHTNSSTPIQ